MNIFETLVSYRVWIGAATAISFVAFWAWLLLVMRPLTEDLRAAQPELADKEKYDLFQFQLFFVRGPGAKAILDRWNDTARAIARKSLQMDYVLMPTYALFWIGFCLLAAGWA